MTLSLTALAPNGRKIHRLTCLTDILNSAYLSLQIFYGISIYRDRTHIQCNLIKKSSSKYTNFNTFLQAIILIMFLCCCQKNLISFSVSRLTFISCAKRASLNYLYTHINKKIYHFSYKTIIWIFQVTQLKIVSNPFAKGFRENDTNDEWVYQ